MSQSDKVRLAQAIHCCCFAANSGDGFRKIYFAQILFDCFAIDVVSATPPIGADAPPPAQYSARQWLVAEP